MLFSLNVMETIKKLVFFYMAFAFVSSYKATSIIRQTMPANIWQRKIIPAQQSLKEWKLHLFVQVSKTDHINPCLLDKETLFCNIAKQKHTVELMVNIGKQFPKYFSIKSLPARCQGGFFCRIYMLQNAWHFFSKNMEWNLMQIIN